MYVIHLMMCWLFNRILEVTRDLYLFLKNSANEWEVEKVHSAPFNKFSNLSANSQEFSIAKLEYILLLFTVIYCQPRYSILSIFNCLCLNTKLHSLCTCALQWKLNGSECTDLKFHRANYGNSFLKHFQLKQFVNTK